MVFGLLWVVVVVRTGHMKETQLILLFMCCVSVSGRTGIWW